jgi:DHA1 family bicyclomycin/chloramphenicol resistance-like MFS transporter
MSDRAEWSYIGFLALLTATPALATDMYLAAIPTIARQWNSSESVISLSLVLWFVSFSVCLLVWGPISDRTGRKPVLITGLFVFVASSVLCSVAGTPAQLIGFRVLQGIGAASPSTMVMAICRDRFEGAVRQKVLGFIGVVMPVVPMVAPAIGAGVMAGGSWRWIFIVQASLATVSLGLSLGLRETAELEVGGGFVDSFRRYGRLLGNGRFVAANTTMGLSLGPLFGFIAFSPIVYQKIFLLPEIGFALLFGANAVAAMLGAGLCVRLVSRMSQYRLLTISFVGILVAGIGLLAVGGAHAFVFAALMGVASVCIGLSRPLSNHLVLEQVSHDIGSASSFLVFYQGMVGAVSMWFACLAWAKPILAFGVLVVSLSGVILAVWPFLLRALRAGEAE